MDWGYFATAAGLLLSVLTFFFGRHSAAKADGEREGNVMTKLDSIGESIEKIDGRLGNLEMQIGEQRDRLTRLETMVQMYHGGGNHGA